MKAVRKTLALTMVLVCLMSLVACGEKGLVGKWVDKTTAVDNIVEFNKDGTGKMEVEGMFSIDFTYTNTDDKITLTIMGNDVEYDYTLDGDKLTMTIEGQKQEFKRD